MKQTKFKKRLKSLLVKAYEKKVKDHKDGDVFTIVDYMTEPVVLTLTIKKPDDFTVRKILATIDSIYQVDQEEEDLISFDLDNVESSELHYFFGALERFKVKLVDLTI